MLSILMKKMHKHRGRERKCARERKRVRVRAHARQVCLHVSPPPRSHTMKLQSHTNSHLIKGTIKPTESLVRHVRVAVDNDFELPARAHGADERIHAIIANVVVAQIKLLQCIVAWQNLCQVPEDAERGREKRHVCVYVFWGGRGGGEGGGGGGGGWVGGWGWGGGGGGGGGDSACAHTACAHDVHNIEIGSESVMRA